MKRFGLLVFLVSILLGTSCKKDLDPDFPFTIVVKTLADSLRTPNVQVVVSVDVPGNLVFLSGVSGNNGEIDFEYDMEAILDVKATRGQNNDPNQTPSWIGCTNVRLQPNERVYKTVYIQPFNPSIGGCLSIN